jgi:hypothetical protein
VLYPSTQQVQVQKQVQDPVQKQVQDHVQEE